MGPIFMHDEVKRSETITGVPPDCEVLIWRVWGIFITPPHSFSNFRGCVSSVTGLDTNSGEQQERWRQKGTRFEKNESGYKIKPAAPRKHSTPSSQPSQQDSPGSLPELVIPDKLLPRAHHPFPRLLLVFLLWAILIALFWLLPAGHTHTVIDI